MRKAEIRAVGEIAGEALAVGGTLARDMHEGIAGRPFGILGAPAKPIRVIHDGIARAVYGGVRGGLRAVGRGGALIASAGTSDDAPSLTTRVRPALAVGALNGMYGDHLERRRSALAMGMEVRRDDVLVPTTPEGLRDAFPDATARVVVFVHGLCGTEDTWRLFPLRGRHPGRRTYGERLQDELSFTPVYVRYNTGRRISDNGRALARVLDELVTAWPVGVAELVLVGHSMGGLVSRSACHYGESDGHPWTAAVRHVFCLGTPHLGADLEKGANVLGWALGRLPETRALANAINARSVGIKDLRFGSCVEEDWCDCEDPDEYLSDRCQEVPFLADANYYFIGASLGDGPVGRALGDLLVRMPSASGRGNGKGRRIAFEVDNGYELSGLNHFDLLNHPAVYDQLRLWLGRRPARRALPAAVPA